MGFVKRNKPSPLWWEGFPSKKPPGALRPQQLLLVELQGVELVVPPLFRQQLLVAAPLHDLAVGQHDDLVGVLDGGQAVGHDEHGADGAQLLQGGLYEQLRLGVDVGGGLVQDHDGGLVEDGAHKAQKLPLSGGEVPAPLPDLLVQPLVQPSDEGVGVDVLAGGPDLLVGEALLPEDDIAADASSPFITNCVPLSAKTR